jgi:protein-S-isoprenylcysteine O-methyltransferase Ste14
MSSSLALDSGQITKIGVGAIVVLVVLGVLLGLVITAIVGRIIIAVVVVALGVLIWQQRTSIEDHVKKCDLDMSFLGIHVDTPKDVSQHCQSINR